MTNWMMSTLAPHWDNSIQYCWKHHSYFCKCLQEGYKPAPATQEEPEK